MKCTAAWCRRPCRRSATAKRPRHRRRRRIWSFPSRRTSPIRIFRIRRWKIQAYQSIAAIDGEEAREDVTEELIDRYGDMPDCVSTLIDVASLKHLASDCGASSISQRDDAVLIRFLSTAPVDPEKLLSMVASSKGKMMFRRGAAPELSVRVGRDLFGELTNVFRTIRRNDA